MISCDSRNGCFAVANKSALRTSNRPWRRGENQRNSGYHWNCINKVHPIIQRLLLGLTSTACSYMGPNQSHLVFTLLVQHYYCVRNCLQQCSPEGFSILILFIKLNGCCALTEFFAIFPLLRYQLTNAISSPQNQMPTLPSLKWLK